nr:nucleoside hydrolase [Alistipes sp. An116]
MLASQPDSSVVVISVGFATNLRMLLESAPDSVSNLSGEELVARKVRLLSMMGGNFVNPRAREFNIRYDVLSARTLFERFCLSPRGCVTVDDAGHILFKATEHGRVRILSIRSDDRERIVSHIENLVERTLPPPVFQCRIQRDTD